MECQRSASLGLNAAWGTTGSLTEHVQHDVEPRGHSCLTADLRLHHPWAKALDYQAQVLQARCKQLPLLLAGPANNGPGVSSMNAGRELCLQHAWLQGCLSTQVY